MCGRFSLKAAPGDLEKAFGVAPPLGYRARYNIAPMQEVLAITLEEGVSRPRLLRWGLVPFWADDPAIGNRMINARAETVADKAAYRTAFQKRRCLVVADGFYEWQRRPDGKHPLRFRFAGDPPFAFAGLWERWGKGAHPIETCTILTTTANDSVRPTHDRMPVILDTAARARWLAPTTPRDELEALLAPWAGEPLQAYEVSTLVNNPGNDLPQCLDPIPDPAPHPAPELP